MNLWLVPHCLYFVILHISMHVHTGTVPVYDLTYIILCSLAVDSFPRLTEALQSLPLSFILAMKSLFRIVDCVQVCEWEVFLVGWFWISSFPCFLSICQLSSGGHHWQKQQRSFESLQVINLFRSRISL